MRRYTRAGPTRPTGRRSIGLFWRRWKRRWPSTTTSARATAAAAPSSSRSRAARRALAALQGGPRAVVRCTPFGMPCAVRPQRGMPRILNGRRGCTRAGTRAAMCYQPTKRYGRVLSGVGGDRLRPALRPRGRAARRAVPVHALPSTARQVGPVGPVREGRGGGPVGMRCGDTHSVGWRCGVGETHAARDTVRCGIAMQARVPA